MIVTKARDHSLVELTKDLATWLMIMPRYGRRFGVRVYVDAKLEKSKRFDAEGLRKDNQIIREMDLLRYWTPETCVYADTFDFVITVCILSVEG
jgi:NAD+ kinase